VKVNYIYIYTVMSAFFRIVPIASTSMIGLLGAFHFYLSSEGSFVCSALLFTAYFIIDYQLSEDIYKQVGTKPYLIGMSVFLGYYAFDLQGIFYGPLLASLVPIVYNHLEGLNAGRGDSPVQG